MPTKIIPINVDNFQKFGKVVRLPEDNPTASGDTFQFWADIAHYEIEGETEIGLCMVTAPAGNRIDGLERHLRTPEVLIPVHTPFALPVLVDGELEDNLQVFRVNVGEAVVINAGVWHSASLPLGNPEATYFVIFRRGTPSEDVEKRIINSTEIDI